MSLPFDPGKMKPHEEESVNTILCAMVGRHFSKSASDYIKVMLDAHTMIEQSEWKNVPAFVEKTSAEDYYDYASWYMNKWINGGHN